MADEDLDAEPKTFTQEEVDRMVGRARGEAKRSAASELAEQLGCTVEEAKAKIAAVTAADDALKSETQRALDAANEAKAEATRARAAADAERLAAKVERKLAAAGADPQTLARPWAIPGTPGLEHRIGGIEKADVTGDISYDPDNHERMTQLRQAKVDGITVPDMEVDDPSGSARILVLGWGSTYGPIAAAARAARANGLPVATAHLRHLNPMPANTGAVLRSYDRVLIPEMNAGQLALLIRAKFLVDAQSYARVRGLPFTTAELLEAITALAP